MGTIEIADVQRGDILLVTKRPDDPLAQMIIDLDGSPDGFSHSGIAGGDGTIISSYPSGLSNLLPVRVRGLNYDPFSHFWDLGQEVHRLVPPEGLDREAALERLDAYPPSRPTTFGVASIVMVAAALHALLHEDRVGKEGTAAIVSQAIVAGEAWASEDEFFCAEFAAHVYDLTSWPFTVAELRPPGSVRGVRELFTDVAIEIGLQALLQGRTEEQRETLEDFVAAVQEYDAQFFEDGVEVLGRQFLQGLGTKSRGREVDETAVVPGALITPRMLAAWGQGTERIRES